MTPISAQVAGVGRKAYWTRDKIIERFERFAELYGDAPISADLNPASAKWSGQMWRADRYREGDPESGEAWPSLNTVRSAFGSITAARVAAGFPPSRHGPLRRSEAAPALDQGSIPMHPTVRVALEAARAEARDAVETMEIRERQLAEQRRRNLSLAEERDGARRAARKRVTRTKTKTKTVVREDARAVKRARAEVRAESRAEFKADLDSARLELASTRRDATRLAAKLERAEATIHTIRHDRRALKDDLRRAEDRATRAEDRLTAATRRAQAIPKPEVKEVVRVEREVVKLPPPEAEEVEAARRLAAEADRMISTAEERVAKAEREYREIAEAATGEARKLTDGEMRKLREAGPSGPAVLGAALKRLALARSRNGRTPLKQALWDVASAAIRWRDRL